MPSFLALIPVLCLLWLLSACAEPEEQPFREATHTPAITDDHILASDGEKLALQRWLPEETPKAAVVAIHGFNDYSNAFAGIGGHLAGQGIAVYAYDQRGYGNSGEHGIWAGKQNLTRDLRAAVTAVKQHHPSLPLYVMGESMGGAVTVITAAEGGLDGVSGLVLVAPAVWGDVTMGWLYRMPLWLGAHSFPDRRVSNEGMELWPSDNLEMLEAFTNDPLVIKQSRIDTIYGIVHLMDEAYRATDTIEMPALLLYGANDQVIPKPPILDVMERMRKHRAAYYPKGYHMLTRDLQGDVVHRDVAAWILDQQTDLPSGFDREVASRLHEDLQKKQPWWF